MARNLALAGAIAVLAPLLCMAAIYLGDSSFAPSLLSAPAASPAAAAAAAPAVPVPQPLTLQPAVSAERALNVLPLWHGRLDEDVMANPPPPFYSHAPFAHTSSPLRSAAEFASNGQIAAVAGLQDSYQAMKAQYKAQEEKMRRVTQAATYNIRPANIHALAAAPVTAASSHRALPTARQQSARTFPRAVSRFSTQGSRDDGRYAYSHAGFVRDTSFYKAANSRIGIAKFDANLASTIQQRRPHLAKDLKHISASIIGSLRPLVRAPAAPRAVVSTAAAAAHLPTSPLAALQPLLPATLRRKLMPHDTSFYQAANSRDGIAAFDAHLATEIQERRPNLAQDLTRISAAIRSSSLSSLKPLLPPITQGGQAQPSAPKSGLASADHLDSLRPLLPNSGKQVAEAPGVAFVHEQHNVPNDVDYAHIYQQHSSPTSHFPQQEEAWIKFAASGASFGGNTKEQRDAVKKVWSRVACLHAFGCDAFCRFASWRVNTPKTK